MGPDVNRCAVVEQALGKPGVVPANRYVQWCEAALVGKTVVSTGFEKIFGDSELAVTNTVYESRVIIHGIPHVNPCAMVYQDHRCFHVVMGCGHMQGRDVLAMDVRVYARLEKDP